MGAASADWRSLIADVGLCLAIPQKVYLNQQQLQDTAKAIADEISRMLIILRRKVSFGP